MRRGPSARTTACAIAVFLTAFAIASPASASLQWSAPVDVSAPGIRAGRPMLATSPGGHTVATWLDHDGYAVQGAEKDVGTGWTPPLDLGFGNLSTETQIAVDDSGGAVALWDGFAIGSAAKPAGGSWSPQTEIASDFFFDYRNARIAGDPAGLLAAVWLAVDGPLHYIEAATRSADGSWSNPVIISPEDRQSAEPDVAVDAAGNATAVWHSAVGEPGHNLDFAVETASLPMDGSWSAPLRLTAGSEEAGDSSVAVNASGQAVAAWRTVSQDEEVVTVARRPAAGSWTEPEGISQPDGFLESLRPQVGVAANGEAIALWSGEGDAGGVVESTRMQAGGTWSAPTDVSAPDGDASGEQLITRPSGEVLAVWLSQEGEIETVEVAEGAAAGSWTVPEEVSPPAEGEEETLFNPHATIDPSGGAVAIWSLYDHGEEVVQAATRDDGVAPEVEAPAPRPPSPAEAPPPVVYPSCPKLTIVGARGSGEPAGLGGPLGEFARRLKRQLYAWRGIGFYATTALRYPAVRVDFPHTFKSFLPVDIDALLEQNLSRTFGTPYDHSVATGRAHLRQALRGNPCLGETWYVIAGYSQGAEVVGDVLAEGLPRKVLRRTAAVVLFGDPKYNSRESAAQRFGRRNAPQQGVRRARRKGSWAKVARTVPILSYCHGNDLMCNFDFRRPQLIVRLPGRGHTNYDSRGADDAANRVARLLRQR